MSTATEPEEAGSARRQAEAKPEHSKPGTASEGAAEAYDAVVTRLERVVGDLESGKLTLEQSIEKFAEGVRLAREATRKLDDAERRVDLLVRAADGTDEQVPFDAEAGKARG